jgi:hypothetical protein
MLTCTTIICLQFANVFVISHYTSAAVARQTLLHRDIRKIAGSFISWLRILYLECNIETQIYA